MSISVTYYPDRLSRICVCLRGAGFRGSGAAAGTEKTRIVVAAENAAILSIKELAVIGCKRLDSDIQQIDLIAPFQSLTPVP